MNEGWHNSDYLILLDRDEAESYSASSGLSGLLPGFLLRGLRNWDDFIVEDSNRRSFTVPTIPIIESFIQRFDLPNGVIQLTPDARFAGRIKWLVKPLAFGGDPNSESNMSWITLEAHAQFVRFWNDLYRRLAAKSS